MTTLLAKHIFADTTAPRRVAGLLLLSLPLSLLAMASLGAKAVAANAAVNGGPSGASGAVAELASFYRRYLESLNHPATSKAAPEPPFSRSFKALREQDRRTCAAKAAGDLCGWGADADVYLDAQDYGAGLTFEKAKVKVTQTKPDEVTVTLNLFPDEKGAKAAPQKVVFRVLQEGGRWVVDDVIDDGLSGREAMQDEIDAYTVTPPGNNAR